MVEKPIERKMDSISTMEKLQYIQISPEVLARQKRTHNFNAGILENW